MIIWYIGNAQNLDQIGKAPLVKVNGGISANSVFYEGSANRDAFTYFLNGNLNFNISGVYNIPLSFSYTNQDFAYSTPFKINRLSIHPSYKWVTTHIGDVAMTFSPYTVNGHQFTGFGVDLAPNQPYKTSTFYGRLLKPSEYDPEFPENIPVYRRMGYGVKGSYDFQNFMLGATFFKAKDDQNSLEVPFPQEINLTPRENIVVSLEADANIMKSLTMHLEVAQSGVTYNSNETEESDRSHPIGLLLDTNASTEFYTALNTNLTYAYGSGSLGIAYERIDPEYQTFGAYFFNNDLENITLNASQQLFNSKVSLSVNAGLQRDDLENNKESQSNRIVSAFNIGYQASEKLNIQATYSNFQSYTNIKRTFDLINQTDPLINADTLDFSQVSQNAALNANYILSQSEQKQQSLGVNLNYQTTKDEQGTALDTNLKTDFYNGGANYSIAYPTIALSINGAINAAYNQVAGSDALTYGPTLAVSKQFFEKKLRTGLSSSYNQSLTNGISQGSVLNFRTNANYTLKAKHNFSLNGLALFRNTAGRDQNQDFTITLGYSYSFDVKKEDLGFKKRRKDGDSEITQSEKVKDTLQRIEEKSKKEKRSVNDYFRFRYRGVIYDGNTTEVTQAIQQITTKEFIANPEAFGKDDLSKQLQQLEREKPSHFKEKAINYLDSVYLRKDFVSVYRNQLQMAFRELAMELSYKEQEMKDRIARAKTELESHALHTFPANERQNVEATQQKGYADLTKAYKEESKRFEAYSFMYFEIDKWHNGAMTKEEESKFKKIEPNIKETSFRKYQKEKGINEINKYLKGQIIMYFDRLFRKG